MRKTLKKFESPKKNKLGDLQVISLIDVKSGLAPFDKLKIHENFFFFSLTWVFGPVCVYLD